MSIVLDVREREITENAGVRLRQARLVRAQVEARPVVSTKQERTLHCLIRNNEYPYRKTRGWRAVMVKLDGYPVGGG